MKNEPNLEMKRTAGAWTQLKVFS